MTTPLIWALWIVSGGYVNSGYLSQVEVKAYFTDVKECSRVGKVIDDLAVIDRGNGKEHLIRYQCVQASYIFPNDTQVPQVDMTSLKYSTTLSLPK